MDERKTVTVVRGSADEAVFVVGLPVGDVTLTRLLCEAGSDKAWTEDGEEVLDDATLHQCLGERGCKLLMRGACADAALLNQMEKERRDAVGSVQSQQELTRQHNVSLLADVKDLTRELAIAKHALAEQTKQVEELQRKARGLPSGPAAQRVAPPPAPSTPPQAVKIAFDTELSGTAIEFGDSFESAKSTHVYNKMALTTPAFDTCGETYAEFALTTPFSKYTAIGICLEDGLDRLNSNTDALGEHDFSFAWAAHPYWNASFVHKGQSTGPKGGDWVVGSVVGVLVSHNAVSFYLDGVLLHQHAFHDLSPKFRFAVGFGGPKAVEEGDFGTINIVQPCA